MPALEVARGPLAHVGIAARRGRLEPLARGAAAERRLVARAGPRVGELEHGAVTRQPADRRGDLPRLRLEVRADDEHAPVSGVSPRGGEVFLARAPDRVERHEDGPAPFLGEREARGAQVHVAEAVLVDAARVARVERHGVAREDALLHAERRAPGAGRAERGIEHGDIRLGGVRDHRRGVGAVPGNRAGVLCVHAPIGRRDCGADAGELSLAPARPRRAERGGVQRPGHEAPEVAHTAPHDRTGYAPRPTAAREPGEPHARRDVRLARHAVGAEPEQAVHRPVERRDAAEPRPFEPGAIGKLQAAHHAPRVAQVHGGVLGRATLRGGRDRAREGNGLVRGEAIE